MEPAAARSGIRAAGMPARRDHSLPATRPPASATAHTTPNPPITPNYMALRRLASTVAAWEQQIAAKTRLAEECDRIASVARDHPDPAWLDTLRNPIPPDSVPAHLARLMGQALTSACYESVTWRGLRISFTVERAWRQIVPVATICAYPAELRAELNPAWTVKGQHWRIEKELNARIDGAVAEAERLRGEIQDLSQRVAGAAKRIGEPFPQAAELESARVRRDAIEQQIREAAGPQDEDAATPGGHDDLVAEATRDVFGFAGMDGDHEVTFFTPATITPNAPARDPAPQADSPPSKAAPADAEGVLFETPRGGEPLPAEPDSPRASTPPGQVPQQDSRPPAQLPPGGENPARKPSRHPAHLAQLDWVAEPLFATPAPAPGHALDGGGPRTPRRPARKRARSPAQVAAQDGAAQPALFDLPADAAPAPTRRPGQPRMSKPRK